MINSVCDKQIPDRNIKIAVSVVFAICMILFTVMQVRRVQMKHELKEQYNYEFAPNDLKFETTGKIVKLAIFCMIAAILCGCTGIAGGMVLGPLFLTYNMVPTVMSGTNQYITMIASIATAIQFVYIGNLLIEYAILTGLISLVAAFIGIKAINIVTKSGKQSVITLILVIVLTLALLSLPLNYLIKGEKTNAK